MEWSLFRSYAQELELWTSLAINFWVITSAAIFIGARIRRIKVSIDQVLIWGFVATVVLVGLLGLVEAIVIIPLLISTLRTRQELIAPLLFIAVMIALVAVGALMTKPKLPPNSN